MVLRLLSLALAWLMLCGALQLPDPAVTPSPSTSLHAESLAADAAPPAEGAGDAQELLRTLPGEPTVLPGRDGHGPFVEAALRAPYLDGLQRPPCRARLTA